jgi:hypothetical protein
MLELIKLIMQLIVWYIVFAIATDELNPLKWKILPKIFAICITTSFILLNFN